MLKVVGHKNLHEDRSNSEDWRGKGDIFWDYVVEAMETCEMFDG